LQGSFLYVEHVETILSRGKAPDVDEWRAAAMFVERKQLFEESCATPY
jgi:hypothetical protein